jgi:hypothetical protein
MYVTCFYYKLGGWVFKIVCIVRVLRLIMHASSPLQMSINRNHILVQQIDYGTS